jgi:hypothetical protein
LHTYQVWKEFLALVMLLHDLKLVVAAVVVGVAVVV